MTLKISCSKSSSITFHGSPGMRDQVEIQKKWSQLTSIHQNSKHYLLKAGSENNDFKSSSKSNSITFYGPLGFAIK